MINNNLSAYEYHYVENAMREKYNFSRKFYFDSSDIVALLQGTWHFNQESRFEWNRFKKQDNVVIHGILNKGWLEKVNLLKPHQNELIYKLTNSDIDFPNKSVFSKEDIFNELIYNLTRTIPKNLFDNLDSKKFINDIKSLKTNSKLLFKSNAILDPFFWFDRYTDLITNTNKVQLSFDSINEQELIQTKIFKKCHNLLNRIRGGKGLPNYLDALAIAQLQDEVNKFIVSEYSEDLPIFYTSSKYLKRAIKQLIEQDPTILSYPHPEKPKRYIPIIRYESYFTIYPIFNIDVIDNLLKEIIIEVNKVRETIDETIPYDYFLNNTVTNEENIKKLIGRDIEIEFFNKLWVEGGYNEFIQSIKNIVKHFDDETVDDSLIEYIKNEKKKLENDFDSELHYTALLKTIIKAMRNIYSESSNIKKRYPLQENPSLDFGLIRFSLPGNINKLIDEVLISIFDNLNKRDTEQHQVFSTSVSRVIDFLSFRKKDRKEVHELIAGLSVLWIFSKYTAIVEICRLFEEYHVEKINKDLELYNSFYSIYIASIAHCSELDQNLFNRLFNNYNDKIKARDYRFYITRSFSTFQLWFILTTRPIIPEFPNEIQQDHIVKYNDLLQRAISLLEDSIEMLRKLDYEKNNHLRKVFFYVLNNLIYYSTKGAKKEDILTETFNGFIAQLEAALHNENITQKRFFDTLGWYYYRLAYISYNENEVNNAQKLNRIAKKHNKESFKGPTPKREHSNYIQLQESIQKLEFAIEKEIKKHKVTKG